MDDPNPSLAEQCGQTAGVDGAHFGNWELEQVRDDQSVSTDLADDRQAVERLGRAGDDERGPEVLTERVQPLRQPDHRADAAGDAALGQRHRDPALGDVVRAREVPRADALADPRMGVADR